jgi:hypothetical protein
VNEDTMRRWLREGFVPGARIGTTGEGSTLERRHWRIPRAAFLKAIGRLGGHSPANPSRSLESYKRTG